MYCYIIGHWIMYYYIFVCLGWGLGFVLGVGSRLGLLLLGIGLLVGLWLSYLVCFLVVIESDVV